MKGVLMFQIRPIRVLAAIAVGSVGYFAVLWFGSGVLHQYRVWANDGVWCALGNNAIGWTNAYGEENCPEL